jgi:hypothetical protein
VADSRGFCAGRAGAAGTGRYAVAAVGHPGGARLARRSPQARRFGFLAGWMVRRTVLTVAFVGLSDLLGGDLDKPPPVGIVAAHHARSGAQRGRGLALAHSPPFGAFAGLAADDPHHHAGANAERFQALHQRAEQIREQERQRTTARRDLLEALASGRAMTEGEGSGVQPYTRDEDRPPAVQQRDNAMRVLERRVKAGDRAQRGAELVESLMGTGTPLSQTWTQRWAIATGTTGPRSRRTSPTPTTANSPGPLRKPTRGGQ